MAASVDSSSNVISDQIDPDRSIARTPFTVGWLLKILSEEDDEFVRKSRGTVVSDVDAYDISGGKGFISRVFKVTLTFADGRDPHVVILKVPGTEAFGDLHQDDVNPAQVARVANAHNREVYFYKNLAPKLESMHFVKVYEALEWIPGKQMGCLLMESLLDQADVQSVHSGLSKHQLKSIALELAKLHSSFLLAPESEWKGKFPNTTLKSESVVKFLVPTMKLMAEQRPDHFKKAIKKLLPYASSLKFHDYTTSGIAEDVGLPTVLIHGDMWTNNVMFKLNADGSVGNEIQAVLDWQIINEGCVTFDFARLFLLSCDGDVRRELEDEILGYYYENLVKLLAEGGQDAYFTLKQIKIAYEVNMLNQTLHAIAVTPLFAKIQGKTPEERAMWKARQDRLALRAQLAMEDALKVLKDIPGEKLL